MVLPFDLESCISHAYASVFLEHFTLSDSFSDPPKNKVQPPKVPHQQLPPLPSSFFDDLPAGGTEVASHAEVEL